VRELAGSRERTVALLASVSEVSTRLAELSPIVPEVRPSALGDDAVVDGCLAIGGYQLWERVTTSRAQACRSRSLLRLGAGRRSTLWRQGTEARGRARSSRFGRSQGKAEEMGGTGLEMARRSID